MHAMRGGRFTQADLWLFPTAVRFDAVYATLFKCTQRRIRDYPHIQAWLQDTWRLSVANRSKVLPSLVLVWSCSVQEAMQVFRYRHNATRVNQG